MAPKAATVPQSYVRRLALRNADVDKLSADGVKALQKATDLFLGKFVLDASKTMPTDRDVLIYEDLVAARKEQSRLYEFLEVRCK